MKDRCSTHCSSFRVLKLEFAAVAMVAFAFATVGCGGSKGSTTPPPSTTPLLRSIAVSSGSQSVIVNGTQQFTATGSYSDGSSKNVTTQATWSSTSVNVASVSGSGMATGLSAGTTTISAAIGSVSGSKIMAVTPILTSIAVSPSTPSLLANGSQQFSATGTWSDASSQDVTAQVMWSSSDSSVVTVNNVGMAIAVAAGHATVTATLGSIAGSTVATVIAPTLTSIVLSPDQASIALGISQSFVATGIFSDSRSTVLTSVNWTSSDTTLVTIDNNGLATTVAPGNVVISATEGSVTGTTGLTVLPAQLVSISLLPSTPSLSLGTSTQMSAVGLFTDNSTQTLSSATWSSSDSTIATVDVNGLANSAATGSAIITAASGSISGNTVLTVTNATVSLITVTPANPSVPTNTTAQFTATATFTDATTQDITNSATWTSSDGSIATVSNSGLASALTAGSATITATLGSVSGTAILTATAATLQSVSVAPQSLTMATGTVAQLTATGHYSDNTTQDLTGLAVWSSSVGGVASVDSTGLVTARKAGSSIITATFGGQSGSTTTTAAARTIASIVVSPANPSVGVGHTLQFTATAHYADQTSQDITASAHWSTSSASLATINSGTGGGGLATGKAAGSVTITATLSGASGTTTLTVN